MKTVRPQKPVTASQMQAIDRKAIEEYGIPSLVLMENAGRGIAELITSFLRSGRITILAGKGNNGGDGMVIARHLHNHGYQVYVLICSEESALKEEARVQFQIIRKMKIPFQCLAQEASTDSLKEIFQKTDLVVDALFGIGLKSDLSGWYEALVSAVNQTAKRIVAVDIPSGLQADTGEILGCCIQATHTATLGLPKKGLLVGRGPEMCGQVCVLDIGIPREILG